mgnify:CR=1 FL=1
MIYQGKQKEREPMPKYRVIFYYHGSASYDVEAEVDYLAVQEAHLLNNLESEKEFRERLTLDFTDARVEEDKEAGEP